MLMKLAKSAKNEMGEANSQMAVLHCPGPISTRALRAQPPSFLLHFYWFDQLEERRDEREALLSFFAVEPWKEAQ